jgi:hypothetical protein
MPIPGSNDDGTMVADLAHFDLLREMTASEQSRRWPSGIHARTLGFQGRSGLHGGCRPDEGTPRRWHELRAGVERTHPLQRTRAGL